MFSAPLRLIAAQINPLVGDIEGNAAKIIRVALEARDFYKGDAVIFPEMVITGYPPEDLLLRQELYSRVQKGLALIREKVTGIHVVIGYPEITASSRFNAACVIHNGQIISRYYKQHLPNYGVFDEKRHFEVGDAPCIFQLKGLKIALTICEDLWCQGIIEQARAGGAQLTLSINASPFDMQKCLLRKQIIGERARKGKMPIVYVNCVGGQDELVFDGGSIVFNAQGEVTHQAGFFKEALLPIDFGVEDNNSKAAGLTVNFVASHNEGELSEQHPQTLSPLRSQGVSISSKSLPTIEELTYNTLVTGVRDYVNKNNFPGALVSVSGGIDSAFTLAVAVDALGKDRVQTLYMPSRHSSDLSTEIVQQQTRTLGVKLSTISIEPIFMQFLESLKVEFAAYPPDITEENLQARCRGTLLMAFSNKKHLVVLSTGNKSEMAVGYATLYGDMAGGFCVLKDVYKTMIFRLAKYRNSLAPSPVIPQSVIDRAPSAELAPNQKDVDTLPPYPILDAILERYIEAEESAEEIAVAGFEKEMVDKVINMVKRNEYKRRQAPPGPRVTTKSFGRDRRYPITSGF